MTVRKEYVIFLERNKYQLNINIPIIKNKMNRFETLKVTPRYHIVKMDIMYHSAWQQQ